MPKLLLLHFPHASFRLLQHMEAAPSLFYRRKQHKEDEWPGPIQKPREELGIQIQTLET